MMKTRHEEVVVAELCGRRFEKLESLCRGFATIGDLLFVCGSVVGRSKNVTVLVPCDETGVRFL